MTKPVEINEKTKVPVYVIGTAVALAVLMTSQWYVLKSEVEKIGDNSMTIQQGQDWIDDARDKNPSINWPRLPEKKQSKTAPASADVVLTKRDE